MENTEKSGNFVCIDSFYLKWTKQHVKIHIAAFQKQTSHLLWVWLLGEDTAFLPDEQSFFKCNQSSYHSIFKSATYVFHLFAIFENGCNHNLQSKVRVWMLLQVLVIKPIYLIRQLVICMHFSHKGSSDGWYFEVNLVELEEIQLVYEKSRIYKGF